jgi:3-oxoacyl-[acyl-carrier protein] reductase
MITNKNIKKNVLITGSTSGLGFFLAKLFIKDDFNVFINGTSKSKLDLVKTKLGVNGYACDVTKEKDCIELVKNCEKLLGNIDILICNVGSGSSTITGTETLKEWKRVFDINLFSTINSIDALVKSPNTSATSVICISSICGHEYIPGAPATYSVAKSALNSYIKIYSKYLETKKINLNGLVCGNILFKGSVWEKKLKKDKKIQSQVLKDVPVKKFATPLDIYKAIGVFLDNESSFLSGSLLRIDGGQTRSN